MTSTERNVEFVIDQLTQTQGEKQTEQELEETEQNPSLKQRLQRERKPTKRKLGLSIEKQEDIAIHLTKFNEELNGIIKTPVTYFDIITPYFDASINFRVNILNFMK